jgi:hypothetical protein
MGENKPDQEIEQVPQPPQPPEFDRKLHFYPFQLIGIPILLLIPLLALFGVFGETSTSVEQSENGITLNIQYSNRVHFQGLDGTEIHVQNTRSQPIPLLTVSIEKAFLDNYSDISFIPDVDEITDEAYFIRLEDVQPGETRVVTYDSKGKLVGSHQGTITAAASDGDDTPVSASTAVILEVFIFP